MMERVTPSALARLEMARERARVAGRRGFGRGAGPADDLEGWAQRWQRARELGARGHNRPQAG